VTRRSSCSRRQLREPRETRLGALAQRLERRRGNHHCAPEARLDGEWNSNGRADARSTGGLRDHALQPRVIVEASRPAALAHLGYDVGALERPPRTDRERLTALGEAGELGGSAVGLVAHDAHERDVNDAPHLLGNDGKDLVRGHAGGDERRDAPQRSLFLGE
jgi:hypothetical protein